jgi:trans-aconitate methyltransferase
VSFEVDAESYGRFMGRFSRPLAAVLADVVDVSEGQRALDVGCGPGALTDVLVSRLGVDHVSAADPSESFVAAVRHKYPSMDVRLSTAETLDFPDAAFDLALACLVVHFMAEPVRGLSRMTRTVTPGGVVGACVWDHAGGRGPLGLFWQVVRENDPQAPDESHLPGVVEGDLPNLLAAAALREVRSTALEVSVMHQDFDDWWQPFTRGVGPAGSYVSALDPQARDRLEQALRRRLPDGPFATTALAWAAWGRRSNADE